MSTIGQEQTFSADGPGWIKLEVLRGLMPIKRARIDQLREQFGHRFEYREPDKTAAPLWIHAPSWLAAWHDTARSVSGATAAGDKVDQSERLKRIQANREDLRYQKDLEVLLHVRDATRDVDLFASAVRKGIERLPPACQEIMLAAIDEAENEWIRRHGDGLQRADAQIDGSAGGLVASDQFRATSSSAHAS